MKSSGTPEHRDPAAIEAEAMAWLAERDEGFAPGRAAAFDAWRRRDPRHAATIADLEQVIAHLDGLAGRREEVNRHFDRVSPPKPAPASAPAGGMATRWRRPVAWGGLAAALAVGVFFGLRVPPSTVAPGTRYATAPAGYERTRLEDGSTLELNASSAARVRFTAGERLVELESGEAHFEVAHDPSRPFIVNAAGVAVRAVGTAFNVRFAPGAVEVMVTEGKIEVERADPGARSGADPVRGAGRSPPPAALAAGERVTVSLAAAASPAVEIVRLAPSDVRAALAWQRRVMDFSDLPLTEVAARFNRHHAVQIIIADPALGARRVGGMFALDDAEAFVRLLERDGIVRAERDGVTVRLFAP